MARRCRSAVECAPVADLASALAQPDHRLKLMALKGVLDAADASAVDAVAAALHREDNAKVKNAMALVIGRLGTKTHGAVLARLLRDPDASVRMRAVEGIVALKDSGSYPALVGSLVSETDARVRDFCAHHLMKLGGDRLMQLFQLMLNSDVAWMKEAAVMALALFNSPRVVPMLKLAYLKESAPLQELVLRALKRLSEMGNEAAKTVTAELEALREPPRLDVDFANLEDDTGGSEPGLEDTYTGGKLPRIEMGSPLEEEPEDAPPVAVPAPPPAEPEDTPATVAVPAPGASTPRLKVPPEAAAPPPAPVATSTPKLRVPPEAIAAPPQPPPRIAPAASRAAAASGSARRPEKADRSGELEWSGEMDRPGNVDGGMVAPRRGDSAADEEEADYQPSGIIGEEPTSAPVALLVVAGLTVVVSALEAAQSFAVDAKTEGGVAMARGAIRIIELFAAVGAARGAAWGWWIWLPLAFVYFIAAVSNGEAFPAARTCICLLVLTHASIRDYCSK